MAQKAKEQKTASIARRAFDILEFCEAYHIGRSTAYEEIRAGRLNIFKVGKLTRISVEAAENWRRQREEVATLDPRLDRGCEHRACCIQVPCRRSGRALANGKRSRG